jgi:hypothetical protein
MSSNELQEHGTNGLLTMHHPLVFLKAGVITLCSTTRKTAIQLCWNKRGSDMTQLSFDDNKDINIQ